MSDAKLYDDDIALWADRQADLLRRHAGNEIDWENIAEEIEDVAGSQRREIEHRLAVLCTHLLKWQFQPLLRSGSWAGSVTGARNRIELVTDNSPSLSPYPNKVLAKAYAAGRRVAGSETGLKELPIECPWSIDQVLSHDFWPES